MMFFTLSSDCRPPEVAPSSPRPSAPSFPSGRPSRGRVPRATSYRIVDSPAGYDDFFIDEFVTGTSLVSPVALIHGFPTGQ